MTDEQPAPRHLTPAVDAATAAGMPHRVVEFGPVRSIEEAAAAVGLDVGAVIKTLVVRRGDDDYVFVLVPGDRVIDWPQLRAHLGVNRASMPDRDEARAATGYEVGTITPFGARQAWPVVADATIPQRGRVAIGGGARGVQLHVDGDVLVRHLGAAVADVTAPA